ncbi:MAG: DUF3180 domain-containing protein, partial [Actinomycetota bacterium]|nr:DUF3180 domain-containing protein [Actinomycetota bacterium]
RLTGAPGTRPMNPLGAARMAALAKACTHGGAVLAGGYAGVAVYLLLHTESTARRVDAGLSVLSLVGSAAVLGAGVFLERVCRVRPPDDDAPTGATG